jgi:hypothetical protein
MGDDAIGGESGKEQLLRSTCPPVRRELSSKSMKNIELKILFYKPKPFCLKRNNKISPEFFEAVAIFKHMASSLSPAK